MFDFLAGPKNRNSVGYVRSSLRFLSIAIQAESSSPFQTTKPSCSCTCGSEKGNCCRMATCSCRMWASTPLFGSTHTQHATHGKTGESSRRACQRSNFRPSTSFPAHAPSAAHQIPPPCLGSLPPRISLSFFLRSMTDFSSVVGPVRILRNQSPARIKPSPFN